MHSPPETTPKPLAEPLGVADTTTIFEVIFHNTYTFTALLDPQGKLITVNRPALEFIKLDPEEIFGLPLWQLPIWSPASSQRVQAAVQRAAQGDFVRHQTEALSAQGTHRVVDFSLRAVYGPRGEMSYLIAEGQDITDKYESQMRYRALLDALSEGVVQQERGGTISACNAAAERILGLTQAQMMGLSPTDPSWWAVHEDGSPYPGETHPSMMALQTGEAQHHKVKGVYKPDKRLTWIMISA